MLLLGHLSRRFRNYCQFQTLFIFRCNKWEYDTRTYVACQSMWLNTDLKLKLQANSRSIHSGQKLTNHTVPHKSLHIWIYIIYITYSRGRRHIYKSLKKQHKMYIFFFKSLIFLLRCFVENSPFRLIYNCQVMCKLLVGVVGRLMYNA